MAKTKKTEEPAQDQSAMDALAAAIKKLNTKHKENLIVDIRKVDKSFKRVSTGIIGLDEALGGGWPVGVLCELYGKNQSGKTTTVFEAARQFQKLVPGKQVIIIDAECKMNLAYGEQLGVKIEELIFCQSRSIEKNTEVIEDLGSLGLISAIFIDSLAALSSENELETDMSDYTRNNKGMALQKLGEMLKRLPEVARKNNIFIAFTNQVRYKQDGYGNPEIRPGGQAPEFYPALRVRLKKGDAINKDGSEIGHELEYYVEKNQTAPPHRTSDVKLIWGEGIDRIDSLLQVAVNHNVIQRNGAWYSYKDQKIGQGRDSASEFLKENTDIYDEVYKQVMSKV